MKNIIIILVSLLLFTACASVSLPIYKMYPAENETGEEDKVTLIVTGMLQVVSIDGVESMPKGKYGTVYKLLPGTHRIIAKLLYVDEPSLEEKLNAWRGLGSGWLTTTIYSSGDMEVQVTVSPEYTYMLQVITSEDMNNATIFSHRGKNPLVLDDGTVIVLNFEKKTVEVRKGKEKRDYSMFINQMDYSPDMKHLAFPVLLSDFFAYYFVIVRDGVPDESQRFAEFIYSVWSSDSRHYAYVIRSGFGLIKPKWVVIDSTRKGPYDIVCTGYPFFFSSDNVLYYGVKKDDGKYYYIRGDKEQKVASYKELAILLKSAWEAELKNRPDK
ncbi:MAG: hypothetical protein JXD23_14695 [Spirochaetales bacterium]|nr:hypothetical protein [Spirochaetales bacterium]